MPSPYFILGRVIGYLLFSLLRRYAHPLVLVIAQAALTALLPPLSRLTARPPFRPTLIYMSQAKAATLPGLKGPCSLPCSIFANRANAAVPKAYRPASSLLFPSRQRPLAYPWFYLSM